jgi:replicative DNA helicase
MKKIIENLEAEQAVIGSLISNSDMIYKIIDVLEPADFYHDKNALIFSAILKLFNAGKKIDLLTLKEFLGDKIQHSELLHFTSVHFSAANIGNYAKIVKDKSIRRQLLKAQQLNESEILNEEKDIESVLADTQNKIFSISTFKQEDDSIQRALIDTEHVRHEYAEKYQSGQQYLGIPTGIKKLDDCIDGLRPAHIWVVGGFTSTGKTQFALNIIKNVITAGHKASIISLEMSKTDLVARMIGIHCNISSMKFLKGLLDQDTARAIAEAQDLLNECSLQIHNSYFELEKIKMIIRKDAYAGCKFFVLDYIQNIPSSRAQREYEVLTQSANDLQNLARELGVTIYIVSQISNEAEKGEAAGAGFKGTGALEQVADLAIRLKRNRKEEKDGDQYVPVEIVITKNRHGFTGSIRDYVMWLQSGKFQINHKEDFRICNT